MFEIQILSGFSLMSGKALEKAIEIANEMIMNSENGGEKNESR